MNLSSMHLSNRNGFEIWLMEFDRFLGDWFAELPGNLRQALDFSPVSLSALESELLSKFPSNDEIRKEEFLFYHNAAAIYLGETARKVCGGKWNIDFENKDNVFFGVPVIELNGAGSPICPLALITASLDRRRGDYLEKLVLSWQSKSEAEGVPSKFN